MKNEISIFFGFLVRGQLFKGKDVLNFFKKKYNQS